MIEKPVQFSEDLFRQIDLLQARLKSETGKEYQLSAIVCRMTRLGLDSIEGFERVGKVFGWPDQAAEKPTLKKGAKRRPPKEPQPEPPQFWPAPKHHQR